MRSDCLSGGWALWYSFKIGQAQPVGWMDFGFSWGWLGMGLGLFGVDWCLGWVWIFGLVYTKRYKFSCAFLLPSFGGLVSAFFVTKLTLLFPYIFTLSSHPLLCPLKPQTMLFVLKIFSHSQSSSVRCWDSANLSFLVVSVCSLGWNELESHLLLLSKLEARLSWRRF